MRDYRDNSVTRHGADTRSVDLQFQGEIVVGNFVDRKVRAVVPDVVDERLADVLETRHIESE